MFCCKNSTAFSKKGWNIFLDSQKRSSFALFSKPEMRKLWKTTKCKSWIFCSILKHPVSTWLWSLLLLFSSRQLQKYQRRKKPKKSPLSSPPEMRWSPDSEKVAQNLLFWWWQKNIWPHFKGERAEEAGSKATLHVRDETRRDVLPISGSSWWSKLSKTRFWFPHFRNNFFPLHSLQPSLHSFSKGGPKCDKVVKKNLNFCHPWLSFVRSAKSLTGRFWMEHDERRFSSPKDRADTKRLL